MATADEADCVAPSPITTKTTTNTSSVVAVGFLSLSRSARSRAGARILAIEVTYAVILWSLLLPSPPPSGQTCRRAPHTTGTDRSWNIPAPGERCRQAGPMRPPAQPPDRGSRRDD